MASSASDQTVAEFENSFQACLAALTNPDYFNVQDSEEIKAGAEEAIQNFLDVAKRVEFFFLQQLLFYSAQKPEYKILKNIAELKRELARKEILLKNYYVKLNKWQALHEVSPDTLQLPPTAVPPEPPLNMPHLQWPPMPMPPQVVQQGGGPTHPHHMMQPHFGPPMTSAPMQGGTIFQTQQMHTQQLSGAAQQAGGLQDPLAYLESSMPDPRR